MVLGEVIGVDAAAVIGFDQVESVGVELCERAARIVHVIEHAELHGKVPRPLGFSPIAGAMTGWLAPFDLLDLVGLGSARRHHLDARALALADEGAGER